MATLGTYVYTWFYGVKVGEDTQGNRYFQHKKADPESGRRRRWVLYKGADEPSRIPASWHGWLHYMFDDVPDEEKIVAYDWQKPSEPNKTGTSEAYFPPGHAAKGGERSKVSADYEAWTP